MKKFDLPQIEKIELENNDVITKSIGCPEYTGQECDNKQITCPGIWMD